LVLTVTGEINGKLALQQNVELWALGGDLGIDRFLIDLTNCRNTDSVIGNFDFVHHEANQDRVDAGHVLAFLVSPGDHSHDFVEIAARSAGFNVNRFTDRCLAEAYLRRGANL
jgi:hypothetical protein